MQVFEDLEKYHRKKGFKVYFARRSDVPDVDLPRELENRFFVVFSPLNYKDDSQNRLAVGNFFKSVVGSRPGASCVTAHCHS